MRFPTVFPLDGTFTQRVKRNTGRWTIFRDNTSILFGWTWKPAHRPDASDPLGQRNVLELHLGPLHLYAQWEPPRETEA